VRIKSKKYYWKSDPDKYTIFLSAEASWAPQKNTVKKRTFSLDKTEKKKLGDLPVTRERKASNKWMNNLCFICGQK
jgi:hypothetical protein